MRLEKLLVVVVFRLRLLFSEEAEDIMTDMTATRKEAMTEDLCVSINQRYHGHHFPSERLVFSEEKTGISRCVLI